ncbi:MAG: 3' terminal RNA ribose 2'-O-methyltransferase Hen1 [Clostridia bacterium]|nr:3' terminal RNA ribose 2'-O-methyltransferase Hen1 [Clostridia bacterium]
MILTITWEGQNTQDLGFLLWKHPERAQQFELSYGKAYVFYPEVTDERTTAALVLDIDPIDLARGKLGSKEGGLFDYVNDRPYAATSFMSTAINRVFGSAMKGKSEHRPNLAATPLRLTATVTSLRDRGNETLAQELFEPLGYSVSVSRSKLDDRFPEWGESPYIDLTISGMVKLSELLNHLYVLIPVFDRQKHYYMNEDEIQKLLDHGDGWLAEHPAKERIVKRYFGVRKGMARRAIDRLATGADEDEETAEEAEAAEEAAEDKAARTPLNTQRLEAVKNTVLASGAKSVIDLGCGSAPLTAMLLKEPQIRKITACDVASRVLEKAGQRLNINRMPSALKEKLTLIQGSLTYRDKRFEGFDCACIVEVIEHIEPMRIPAFERVIFEFAKPGTVILTTPNREYNVNYEGLGEDCLRHGDHRFEWTREEFRKWTEHVCEKFGYTCVISGIGETDEATGQPTQMGVFTRNG